MKKLFALILALAVMAALSVPAFATEPPQNGLGVNEEVSIDIQGRYIPVVEDAENYYSVDITWGNMQFTYTQTFVWDETTHDYTKIDSENSGWSGIGSITVTNHSNKGISAVAFHGGHAMFTKNSDGSGELNTKGTVSLGEAESGQAAPTGTVYVVMDPDWVYTTSTEFVKIETITVQIFEYIEGT